MLDFRPTDHVSWDIEPTQDGLVTVRVLVHNHGNLDALRLARIDDAIAEINSANVAGVPVNLKLLKVTDPGQPHDIHLHEDIPPWNAGQGLAFAEFQVFNQHSGTFADGHGNHLYAGESENGHGKAIATIFTSTKITGQDKQLLGGEKDWTFSWYTGADPTGIKPPPAPGACIEDHSNCEWDYQSVVTHELLHLFGLVHDFGQYPDDPEVAANADNRSVTYPVFDAGTVRRFMSTHDQLLLGHFYGPGQHAPADAAQEHGSDGAAFVPADSHRIGATRSGANFPPGPQRLFAGLVRGANFPPLPYRLLGSLMNGGNFPPGPQRLRAEIVAPATQSPGDQVDPGAFDVASVDRAFAIVEEENGLAWWNGSERAEDLLNVTDELWLPDWNDLA